MSARRVLVDLTPLRSSRQYRLLYAGQAVSFIGRQLTVVAAPVQVFDLTGSTLKVGLLGAAQLPALIVGAVIGGSLADAIDRRRLLLVAQVLLAASAVGLAVNAASGRPALWPIYALTALNAGLSGVEAPTRSASVPRLVTPEQLPAAAALTQILFQIGEVVGPALAGLVIAVVSLPAAYIGEALAFAAAMLAAWLMAPLSPGEDRTRAGLASVLEGLRFLRGRRAIQSTFVIDVNAMAFGMPRALFPELAATRFASAGLGGGAGTVGLLFAAPGAGALIGAVTSGWTGRVDRMGRAVILAVLGWGAAITVFGVSPWLWLALLGLAIAGWADVISAVFRQTILQLSVPDRLRGRLSAVHIAVVAGGPRLGDVESGVAAAAIGPQAAAWTGGLACMAGVGVIAKLMPELGRWRRSGATPAPADAPRPG